MSDVDSGNILVADHDGVYVIKMTGDVRLTLCVPFDEFIENLLATDGFCSVVFDLSDATGLDSTTLGLIAKLGVKTQTAKNIKPLIISSDAGIKRLLETMGLDDICEIIDEPASTFCDNEDFVELSADDSANEEAVRLKVLESHCVLMDLNDKNRDTFKDLVQTLKAS